MFIPGLSSGQSLFEARDSLHQFRQEAIARLPITSENDLIALLEMHQNTLFNIFQLSAGDPDETHS